MDQGDDNVLSDVITANKTKSEFRNYESSPRHKVVENHYRLMRSNQTVAFVDRMHEKYSFKDGKTRARMTFREAFKALESYVDCSDPDVSLPNMIHMLQTAEAIRKKGLPDWFQLVGLIHDCGKIMFCLGGVAEDGQEGTATGPQWALGGDTWVVGCKIPDSCVFPHFNDLNPDNQDPIYSTTNGIYSEKCGLNNLKFAYGHDEYLYQMVIANETTIPKEGLAMLRFHSAYPWHTGGAYRQFHAEGDDDLLKWVLEFNKYDLYTKDEAGLDQPVEVLWEYYQGIIDKYFPNEGKGLRW